MGASKKDYQFSIPIFYHQQKEMKEELERINFNKNKTGSKKPEKK